MNDGIMIYMTRKGIKWIELDKDIRDVNDIYRFPSFIKCQI